MAELLLESLEIRNFRLFRHLQIERLGRVNLFVGKNNVGKTALLEALWLYIHRGVPPVIWDLIEARHEGHRPSRDSKTSALVNSERLLALRHLFYGRKDIRKPLSRIEMRSGDGALDDITIGLEWSPTSDPLGSVPLLLVFPQSGASGGYPLDQDYQLRPASEMLQLTKSVFIPASGMSEEQIANLWDRITLTDHERAVLEALRIIAPDVQGVNLRGGENGQERLPFVKVSGFDEPIPLHSLGEGMPRLFGIILALVNAKDGILLVDEIERGFHYSVQPSLWRLVFETAQSLNVQVFATTHSWDSIEAFQQAAQENEQEEGVLISLRRRRDDPEQVVAVLYDEDELGIATRDQLEVR
jgi:hypothetical protein